MQIFEETAETRFLFKVKALQDDFLSLNAGVSFLAQDVQQVVYNS